jgi:ligand-binding SRPBCC domain-containing protein
VRRFRVSSRLAAAPEEVWARVTTPEGINDELWPVVRMTMPRGASVRLGSLGRSWILLAGVLPIDWDDIHVAELREGRGFRERSRLGSARAWHHDRSLDALPGAGCRVVDEIGFDPRLRAVGGLQAFVLEAMFRWRHRRLRRRFGAAV